METLVGGIGCLSITPGEVGQDTPTPQGEVGRDTPTPQGKVGQDTPTPQGKVGQDTPTPQGKVGQDTPTPQGKVSQDTPTPQGKVGQDTPTPQGKVGQDTPTPQGKVGQDTPTPQGKMGQDTPQGKVGQDTPTPQGKVGNHILTRLKDTVLITSLTNNNNSDKNNNKKDTYTAYDSFLKLYGNELAAQEERYQKQVDGLTISLAEKQQEVAALTSTIESLKAAQETPHDSEELREKLALLQQDVRDRAAHVDCLRVELQYSKNEVELTKSRLKKLEEDLDAARQKNVALQNQITATANCDKTEELKEKIESLEETLKTAQQESEKLSKTIEDIEAERDEEIKIIQDALDEAATEREELINTFEKEFQKMTSMNTAREQQLLEDFEWKLREMEKDHKKKLEERDRKAESTLHRARRQAEEAEAELRQKQEKMRNELNAEWEDKLRSECSRLKAELDGLHAEEKHLAVESMKVQKEQEIRALKQSWELRQEEMTKEISTLKDSLTDKDAYYHKELENLRTNADRDVWDLRRKLQRSDEKSWSQQEYLQEKHHEEMERLRGDYKDRVLDLEARLAVAMEHSDEESRLQAEKHHNDEMEYLCEQHRLSMERLREELEAEKFQAVEEARVIVSKHLEYVNTTLREQLAEALTANNQYREELEATKSALTLREEVIASLEEDLTRVKDAEGVVAASCTTSQTSLASSHDSSSSHGSTNSQDRLSLSESVGASLDSQDDAQKSGGSGLLGKVFGSGWFTGSKTKESSRRGSGPGKPST